MRKAQGLSMNVIIIAALALLVLVIIAFIFSGRVQIFGTGIKECSNLGGVCREGSCPSNMVEVGDSESTDCGGNTVCCLRIYGDSGD